MEKYALHGLTRAEDDIIGTFDPNDSEHDFVHPDMLVGPAADTLAIKTAFESLAKKGLLYATQDRYNNTIYRLTRKGKALWKVRAKEEEEGPDLET